MKPVEQGIKKRKHAFAFKSSFYCSITDLKIQKKKKKNERSNDSKERLSIPFFPSLSKQKYSNSIRLDLPATSIRGSDPILASIRSRSFCKCRRQQARNQPRWTPGSWGRVAASRCWRWRVMAVERPVAGRRRAERPAQEARVSVQEPELGSEPALARPTRRPTIRRATAALETNALSEISYH